MVQCLRLRDAIVGVEDVIPGWITKVLHAFQCSQKIKEKKKKKKKKHRRNGYLEDYLSVKCWVDSLSGIEYVSKPRVGSSQIIIFTSVSFFFFCQCWSSLHLDC